MSNDQSKCPGHDRPECASCCWPKTEEFGVNCTIRPLYEKSQNEIMAAALDAVVTGTCAYTMGHDGREIELLRVTPKAQYTAADMTTAAADGFRDGQASVVVENPIAEELYGIYSRDVVRMVSEEWINAIISAGGKVK